MSGIGMCLLGEPDLSVVALLKSAGQQEGVRGDTSRFSSEEIEGQRCTHGYNIFELPNL